MKNNFFLIFFLSFYSNLLIAGELDIKAKNITIDKKTRITIFKNNVEVKDEFDNLLKADYVEYNKDSNFLKLIGNINSKDSNGNVFISKEATYDNNLKIFKSLGKTSLETIKGYKVETSNIILDNNKSSITSSEETIIRDKDNNNIYLNNFSYLKEENIFKSVGSIKVIDKLKNSYNFTQIYIDEKKEEIIGSDAKLFINDKDFMFDNKNKPRVFANTISIKENQSTFIKSNFTMCDYRKKDKCPPWELKAKKMSHDKIKKTIFYESALIKIYDIPIFFFPKLAHPDPTVKRRSGFLVPSYADTKNLGSGINIPYFWAINKDRDLTINSKLFASEHPLFLGEYRQAFKDSNFIFDFGYTEGYKKTSKTKKVGNKSHVFVNFLKDFDTSNKISNNLEINLQHVSDKKYLKLYKIDSELIDYEAEVLENYIDYSRINENKNSFLSLNLNNYRTLADTYNDKYEFILPEINYEKQLFGSKFGYGELRTNFKVHNYDTNKNKRFLTNNLDWNIDRPFAEKILNGKIMTKLKNINYEVKNVDGFKPDTTSEIFGAIGYLASLDFYKSNLGMSNHILTPKMLIKYSPNYMRKEKVDFNLYGKNLFELDRIQSNENFEGGTNLTAGFDYKIKKEKSNIGFSLGQIVNEKKNNKNMPDSSSLDKRFSDVIGNFNYNKNEKFSLEYNFSVDQNYKETNLNDVNMNYIGNNITFKMNYLEEEKKSGNNEYFKTALEYNKGENSIFSFSNKRNLITNSSEFYDLSYEYLNDCFKAGIFYRREFYNDSEIEAENSLMFKITLSTFGSVNSPSISN